MSLDELDEVGRLIGYDGQEKVLRLFEQYVQKKGIEMPEPPEPTAPPPVGLDPYWWQIAGNPEEEVDAIMEEVAEAKGMFPDEVRSSFEELFPGVDLWSMSFGEFDQFLNSLPRPPLKRVCFEELKHNSLIIALFGTVPTFSTQQQLEDFDRKLGEVIAQVAPLLRQLCDSEFPLGGFAAFQGAISVGVRSDHLPRAEEVYLMIAQKAQSLFGIQDVPVTFSNAIGDGADALDPQSSPVSCD